MTELRKINTSSLAVHWSPVVGYVIITCMIKMVVYKADGETGKSEDV